MTHTTTDRPPALAGTISDTVHPRLVLSSLWATLLFVFAYVDIFGFWRADMIDGALEGVIPRVGFTIDQRFLVLTTLYVLVPSLLVAASTMLRWRILRPLTLVLTALYPVSIAVGMVGETWLYYQLGSVVEIVLLLLIARVAGRHRPHQPYAAGRPA